LLTAYLTQTARLLQNPGAPTSLYATGDLTSWINTARGQLAGDGECVRAYATLVVTNNTQSYNFSSISSLGTGVQGVLNVRMITLQVTGGKVMLNSWPWEYFNQYFISQVGAANATPTDWAQFAQGTTGSLFFSPTPNASLTANLDCVCYPIPLVDDTTVEAIPYPWTDAVPYFAAYLALLSSQTSSRQAEALRMMEMYNEFKDRARRYSTPTVMPYQYEQSGIKMPVFPGGVQASVQKGAA
jgi:hypothetical protein